MGINPMNKITIIIRILFAVTLFQRYDHVMFEIYHLLSDDIGQWSKLSHKFLGG